MRIAEFIRTWEPVIFLFLFLYLVVGDLPPLRPWFLLGFSKSCYTTARVIGRAGITAEAAYMSAIKDASLAG